MPRIGDRDDGIFLGVPDLDQRGRVLGHAAAVGNDQRQRFADVCHAPIGQRSRRHILRREVEAQHVDLALRQVLLRVDGVHARNIARDARVDRENPAARDRAARERDVQHPRQRDVVDELAAPGQQARVLLARDALADVAPGGDAGRIHDCSPAAVPASFRAARRMPW